MPKMIVSIDGVVTREVQLTKQRTTVGRRTYNDVVIDNLAVSGEHAALQMDGNEVMVEDLNSTNGTYVNGKPIKRQTLKNGDTIEIGKCKIKFVGAEEASGFDRTVLFRPGEIPGLARPPEAPPLNAVLRVLSGAASGREVALTKVVTTVGKPGVAVASISRRAHGFVVAHVEGSGPPILNGSPISSEPVALKNGDMIELAGTKMQFILS